MKYIDQWLTGLGLEYILPKLKEQGITTPKRLAQLSLRDIYEIGKKDYGVIAQDVEEIMPELVETRANGYKAVKYEKLISLLIEGIKEQQKQIEQLQVKVKQLSKKRKK